MAGTATVAWGGIGFGLGEINFQSLITLPDILTERLIGKPGLNKGFPQTSKRFQPMLRSPDDDHR